MATVPGTPDNVTTIHPAFQPTQADFLQAAAIMHGQGKFASATQAGGADPARYQKSLQRDLLGQDLELETIRPSKSKQPLGEVLTPGQRVIGYPGRDVRGI